MKYQSTSAMNFQNLSSNHRLILGAICIALASQINVSLLTSGMIFTLSVFLLSCFLYFNADLNPIKVSLIVGIASPFFRGTLLFISENNLSKQILQFVITDMTFYICYGLIYYFLYWVKRKEDNRTFFFVIVLCDYLSNLLEISLLLGFKNYTYAIFQTLFFIALIRSIISCVFCFGYSHFTDFLRKEEHQQRYFNYLYIAAIIKSEIYFLEKSENEVEEVMRNAYQLNKNLQKNTFNQEDLKKQALNIAREIHEIKKSYQTVIKGLSAYLDESQSQAMQINEITDILSKYWREIIKQERVTTLIEIKNASTFTVANHYYLVAILSNLFSNSLEAKSTKITLSIYETVNDLRIEFTDNGCGMNEQTLPYIFQPGFSTKFNEKTGDIYRGIGLFHVYLLVTERFLGEITCISQEKIGTTFKLKLPKQTLVERREK